MIIIIRCRRTAVSRPPSTPYLVIIGATSCPNLPSNRRFIGIELTGPIDVSVRPNYQQLFAQAEKAIWNGEKTYFDAEQTALIMENNRRYQQIDPVMQCFSESFTPTEDENEGTFMTAAAIFSELKAKYGASLEAKSLLSFGRCLKNIDGLKRKRTMKGTEYLVIRRK